MKKKCYINARFLSQSTTGVQRYATELVKAIDAVIMENPSYFKQLSFELLSPRNIKWDLQTKTIVKKKIGNLRGHLWEQIELPFYARDGLLINLCNTAPISKKNQIVTIHDAAVFSFPNAFSLPFRLWYKFLFFALSILVKKIITVSSFSKQELLKYLNCSKEKVEVVYEGKEQVFDIEPEEHILDKHNLRERPFLLAVSSMNPNKNFQAIVDALEILGDVDFDIVIAGGMNNKVFSSSLTIPPNVKYVGYVTDGELRALYQHASCFIYPSLYEGFGLPPLEAMACGCPVIVSNAASMPEVCGDAVLYCDPYDPNDIANKIKLIFEDDELRTELRFKGKERADQFTWTQCARETLDVIKEALQQ